MSREDRKEGKFGFHLGIESTVPNVSPKVGDTLYFNHDAKGYFCEWTAHEGVSTEYVHYPHFFKVLAHYPREGAEVEISKIVSNEAVVAEALKYNTSAIEALKSMIQCLKDKTV